MTTNKHDRKEGRSANSGFAKKRVQWLIEHSTSHQLLCYVDSFEFRNPLLRKAAKRYRQAIKDRIINTNKIIIKYKIWDTIKM